MVMVVVEILLKRRCSRCSDGQSDAPSDGWTFVVKEVVCGPRKLFAFVEVELRKGDKRKAHGGRNGGTLWLHRVTYVLRTMSGCTNLYGACYTTSLRQRTQNRAVPTS